jgi:hypothetical protein
LFEVTLNFEMIRQVVQAHQKTGRLYADTPSGVLSLREPCRIEINLVAGSITSCAIIGKSGRRVEGKRAEQELERAGRLHWTFIPQEEKVVQPIAPIPSSREISFFPKRIVLVGQEQMRTWSRVHRRVFALSDGTKNVATISKILSVPLEQVQRALRDLQSLGVISRYDKKDRWSFE